MVDLSVELAGIRLRNPTVLASGFLGTTAGSLVRVAKEGAGAVTIKSLGPEPRKGFNNPTIIEWEHGLLNAVGLSNPGFELGMEELKEAMAKSSAPVFASMFAYKDEDYVRIAEKLDSLKPVLLEVDISCPHVGAEMGPPCAYEPELAGKVTGLMRDVVKNAKLFIKLSPNTHKLRAVAKAVEKAGADGITAINTAGGMIIDPLARRPVLANKFGGVSGPALKPIAVKAIYEIYEEVDLPIIGTGGVTFGKDAIELAMAGATAIGVGSALNYRGVGCFREITKEMEAWLKEEGFTKFSDVIGVAHE